MSEHHESRLAKLARIQEMGVDPWGQRFAERDWVKDVRVRAEEVKFRLESGEDIDLPDFEAGDVDYRQWKKDAGAGEEIGPSVRVAGRIVLLRVQGKLKFITLRDWTGDIQIFVGKAQVGEEAFALAGEFDLGDWIAVEGRLGRTNTAELTVLRASCILCVKRWSRLRRSMLVCKIQK